MTVAGCVLCCPNATRAVHNHSAIEYLDASEGGPESWADILIRLGTVYWSSGQQIAQAAQQPSTPCSAPSGFNRYVLPYPGARKWYLEQRRACGHDT